MHLLHVVQEPAEQRELIGLVEDHERSLELWLGSVLEIVDVLSYHLPVDNQVTLQEYIGKEDRTRASP